MSRINILGVIGILPIILIMSNIYFSAKNEINYYFYNVILNGRGFSGQLFLQGSFKNILDREKFNFSKPALFFFDTSDITGDGPFYSEGFLSPFPLWMHFQGDRLTDGCVEVFYGADSLQNLKKLIQIKDG